MNERKIPYEPSTKKRYEISKDSISRLRIEALKDIQHKLQAEFPVPISISVFGSLVRGKKLTNEIAYDTDVDFNLKFDEEALESLPEEEKSKLISKLKIPMLNTYTIVVFFEKRLKEELEKIREKLKLKEVSEDKIFVNPINGRSIIEAINFARYSEEKDVTDITLSSYFALSIGNAVKKYRDQFL